MKFQTFLPNLAKIQAKFNVQRGFTLIEMLVVIAIFIIMTAVILVNLPNLRSSASLDVVAQEVAVYLRGAQTYTVGTKAGIGGTFGSYGMHLQKNSSNFLLFVKGVPTVGAYQDETDFIQESYLLPGDLFFKQLCRVDLSNNSFVISAPTLDVVYQKPDPEALFYCPDATDNPCDISTNSYVIVSIASRSLPTKQRLIKIYSNGQISVFNDSILCST